MCHFLRLIYYNVIRWLQSTQLFELFLKLFVFFNFIPLALHFLSHSFSAPGIQVDSFNVLFRYNCSLNFYFFSYLQNLNFICIPLHLLQDLNLALQNILLIFIISYLGHIWDDVLLNWLSLFQYIFNSWWEFLSLLIQAFFQGLAPFEIVNLGIDLYILVSLF